MISRRDFMARMACGIGALSLPADGNFLTMEEKKIPRFGLLLGTLENLMRSNPEETLKKVAEIGFKGLEYPGNYGHPAEMLKGIIHKNNLVSIGGGDSMANLTRNFEKYVREFSEMDKKYVLCYWPWMDDGKNKTLEDWKDTAALFNSLGRKFKAAGLRLGYHNHNIEFLPTGGAIPYDIILNNTDPEYVAIQMDIWWIFTAGKDPVDYIGRYPGRFEMCHIKTKEVLAGDKAVQHLDYRNILAHSARAGFKEFILENEIGMADPLEFIEKSYHYLETLFQEPGLVNGA